jgi:DNA/RNA-binding protein KIN17
MRDENGFKCHTQSESHVRQMLLVGEDPRKAINEFSNQFLKDFLQLLKTAHGEKKVHINHFYQEYISNKEHIHMNATRWPSLTEFAKYLGREGLCRVEDNDKGLHISWIDNSPEALRRQDAIRKKERQDRGDEEREKRLIQEQIERAKTDAGTKSDTETEEGGRVLQRAEGEKIKLSFGAKQGETKPLSASDTTADPGKDGPLAPKLEIAEEAAALLPAREGPSEPAKVSMEIAPNRPKNVFAKAAKKNAIGGKRATLVKGQPKKPMSEAERIMKEEIERKRLRESGGPNGNSAKRQRFT